MRITLLRGCYVNGKPRTEGETLDVDAGTLLDLVACAAGQADPRDVSRANDQARARVAAQSRGNRIR